VTPINAVQKLCDQPQAWLQGRGGGGPRAVFAPETRYTPAPEL